MLLRPVRSILPGAVLLAATNLSFAQDRPIDRANLPEVMTAYVETAVDLRNIMAACAPRPPGKWDDGAAVLLESLRAAGLPEVVAAAMQTRLASPVAAGGIDCSGEDMMLRAGLPAGADWESFHRSALERAGVPVVAPVEGDEKLAAARAAVEATLEPQTRMLACLSLLDPLAFVVSYADWDGLIERVAGVFERAGYAPHVYRPILEPAASSVLFEPPADRAGAVASCIADQAWANRFAGFEWFTLLDDVAEPLGVANP